MEGYQSMDLSQGITPFDFNPKILEYLSKRKEVYFVVDSPTFEYNNKWYSVAIIYSTGIDEYLTKIFKEGKLFAFYSTYEDRGQRIGSIPGSFIRGCAIDDVSHLLAEDREEKINQIID